MSRFTSCAAAVALVIAGCGGSTSPAQTPPTQSSPTSGGDPAKKGLNSPTAARLLQEIEAWEAEVEIAPRADPSTGLGDSVVRVEGEPVWPPAGQACLGLVQCCEQLTASDQVFGLLCQVSIAKDGNCDRGLQTVTTVVVESERPMPDACVRRK